jgi:RNA polymerase sigma-70 factor (ECF subfamily)
MSDPRIELYETYKKSIYLYHYRSTLNQHIAEDLTQDTFLRAFQALSNFRGDASLKTWLFKIAHNTYINFSQKRQNKLEVQTNIIDQQMVAQQDQFKRFDDKSLIQLTLLQLPESYRTYIILRDGNGLTYEEISAIMNESIGQVKVGLYRARKKFREMYRQKMEDKG